MDVGIRLLFATKSEELWQEGKRLRPFTAANVVAMAIVFLI